MGERMLRNYMLHTTRAPEGLLPNEAGMTQSKQKIS